MYTLLHIARIITFVTLFLEATTHNVTESFYSDENKIHHENPIFIDKSPENKSGFTRMYNSFVTQSIYISICFGIFCIPLCCYFYCLLQWYRNTVRQRALMEIIWEFLLYRCFRRVEYVWRRIMELIRPPANDDNHVARYRAVRYREY